MADEPIFDSTTERLYARLPDAYRTADRAQNYTLKKYLSGICTVQAEMDRLVARFDRLDVIERAAYSMLPFAQYQRQIFRAVRKNLMKNPTFRDSSGSIVARRNSVLNPSMRAVGAATEVRRNECVNPMPSGTTDWAGLGIVSDSAPWNNTRSAAKIVGDGVALAYCHTGRSARAWVTGTPVVVSATVQGLSGKHVEAYVHRRSTNTYYGGIHNPTVALTGDQQRISATFVLPEDVAANDLDMGILIYGGPTTATPLQDGAFVHVGDCLIEQGQVVLPYFDGSFVGSTYFTHQWVGTTNASASQRMSAATANSGSYLSDASGGTAPFQSEAGVSRVQSRGTTTRVGYRTLNMNFAGNRRVYVRGKVRLDAGVGWNTTMQLIGRDDPNNDSALFTDAQNVSAVVPADGQWHEVTADYLIPAGRTLTSFYISPSANAGNLPLGAGADFKEFLVSNTPGVFFDGYTPVDTESIDYQWSGTPDASEPVAMGRGFGGAAVDWDSDGTAVEGPVIDGDRTADIRISTFFRSHLVPDTQPGQFYSARATLFMVPDETPAGTQVTMKIYDGTGFIAESAPITLPANGSGVNVNCLATAEVGMTNAVRLYFYANGKAFRAQRVLVDQVSGPGVAVGEYFDGDGEDFFTSVYSWQDVPNRSISIYSERASVSPEEETSMGWLPMGQTSDLVDPHSADYEWLDWLGQLVGVDTKKLLGEQERRDAVQFASSGFHAGSQQALEDAARSELIGARYVKVFTHSTDMNIGIGTEWDVLLITKTSETPSPGTIISTIIRKGAKPAGVRLYHRSYEVPWDISDTLDWDERDALTWAQYEEYGVD